MAMPLSERNTAFFAVSLFLGIPALILVVTKDATGYMKFGAHAGGKSLRNPGQNAGPPKPEDILLGQLARTNPLDTRARTSLHMSIGNIYNEQGRFWDAVDQYETARNLALENKGDQIGYTQSALGGAYYQLGKLKRAERELEAAYVIAEPKTAVAFDIAKNLANVRRDLGRLDDALDLYQKVYHDKDLHEAVGAEKWAELNNELGEAYHRKGETDKALMYYNKAWELLQPLPADVDAVSGEMLIRRPADLATTHNHIGQTLHDEGKVLKALSQYKKAVKIQRESLPREHPHQAATHMNIGRAQRDLGEPEKAMGSLEAAEKILLLQGEARASEMPEYGGLLSLKADTIREAGNLPEAEATALKALEVQKAAFETEDNPEMAVAHNGLGSIYHDQKNYKDAIKQYMLALKINLKTVGFRNPETAASYNNLGNVYQDVGDDDRARKNYEKCLEIQKLTVGEKSPELSASFNNIGTILFRQGGNSGNMGQTREALAYFEKSVQIFRDSGMPEKSPERLVYEENLTMAREDLVRRGHKIEEEHPSSTTSSSGNPEVSQEEAEVPPPMVHFGEVEEVLDSLVAEA